MSEENVEIVSRALNALGSNLDGAAEQGLMSQVYAVEVSQGHD